MTRANFWNVWACDPLKKWAAIHTIKYVNNMSNYERYFFSEFTKILVDFFAQKKIMEICR